MTNDFVCKCCKEKNPEALYFKLTFENNKKLIICDSCYQELSMFKMINGKLTECLLLDGIEYTDYQNVIANWDGKIFK